MSNILTNNINPRSGNVINIGGVNDKVSIAGTLTYEDVTSVDSIGIITARQGVVIGTGSSIGNPANNELSLYTNSIERLRLDSSGNVGIGTDDPGNLLHLLGNTPRIEIEDTAGTGNAARPGVFMRDSAGSNLFFMGNDSTTDSKLTLTNYQNDDIAFRTNNTERLSIGNSDNGASVTLKHNTTAGLIGLGDTLGRINFADSNGGEFASIRGENDGTESNLDYPGRISFWTTADNESSPTEQMRIDSSGRLLIGTNSSLAEAARIQSYVPSGGNQILAQSDDLGTTTCIFKAQATRSGGDTNVAELGVYRHSGITDPCSFIRLQAEDTAVLFYWTDNSNIFRSSTNSAHIGTTSGTVVGTQTSDERVKNILGPVEYGLETLKQIEPVRFSLKSQPDIEQLGFIAQQVQPLVPQSVFDTGEHIEGEPEDAPTKLGMEYVALIPVLVNAAKEMATRIETLEARLTALEGGAL